MVQEAQGNHRRLRITLRAALEAARVNCKLLRENFGRAGSMRFLEQIEVAHQEIEAKLRNRCIARRDWKLIEHW